MPELDDVLAHYGIPGMKWGVRKKSSSSVNSYDVVDTKTGTKISVGYDPKKIKMIQQPDGTLKATSKSKRALKEHKKSVAEAMKKAMPDAPDASQAYEARFIAKNVGINKLSNKELEALIKRVNLEKKYTELYPTEKTMMDKGKERAVKMIREEAEARAKGQTGPIGDLIKQGKQVQKAVKKAVKAAEGR